MKKSLVALVVAFALSAALAQTAPQTTTPPPAQPSAQPSAPAQSAPTQATPGQMTPAQPATAQPAGQATPAQAAPVQPGQTSFPACHPVPKKEIKDPAEYNSYTTSLNAPNLQGKILGFENFVRLFPNSAYKDDALEQLMTAYQQEGTAEGNAKMIATAKKLLQADPHSVRALALLAYVSRASVNQAGITPQQVQQAATEARQYGEQGLEALGNMPCPEGANPADVAKLQKQTAVIFHGAVGFAALQQKDYAAAQQHFQAAVDLEPSTPQDSLQDVYNLALAYLEPKPMNPVGLWYIARAAALSKANPQGYAAITNYGKAKYVKYHGGQDGWDQLLAEGASATSNAPPQNFAVAPAPSLADQAAKLANTVDPKKMDFGQWELVLGAGDPATQEKVWSQIKGIDVPFAAIVIDSTKTTLNLAATQDAIQAKRADVTVTMAGPIPAHLMPTVAPGQEVQLVAKPDSYTSNPFMLQMADGRLIAKKEPPKKAPPKRGTTHHRAH